MIDFGFSLHKDRQIDYDANDKSVNRRVAELEPTVLLCIACGSCAATCSAGQFTDFSLRRIITSLKRGEYTGMAEELQKCMLCGKCQMVCPKGVSTRSLLLALRNSLKEYEERRTAAAIKGGESHGV